MCVVVLLCLHKVMAVANDIMSWPLKRYSSYFSITAYIEGFGIFLIKKYICTLKSISNITKYIYFLFMLIYLFATLKQRA